MKVRYTFRVKPTERQKRSLAKTFGCVRVAYNDALRFRTDSYKEGVPVNYNASSANLTATKKTPERAFLNEVSCVPLQQSLRHLQTAYSNFFAKRAKFPSFKSKHGRQSAEFTTSAFKWDAVNRNLTLSKVGRLHVKWSREFTSAPTTVTITKDCAGRYFVTLCLDEVKHALPKTGRSVGIDLGISRLATLSDGTRIPNPRHTAKNAKRLARAQKVLARRKPESKRRERQRLRVAKIHSRISDTRKDTLDKLTARLVREFDVLCIEDLNVRGMVKLPTLAKHISCASFGIFRTMLEYKAVWHGKEIRVADRFFPSSKRCSACGHIHPAMPMGIREFNCVKCGTHHDRDENAAKNILNFAKETSQTTAGNAGSHGRGQHVRPKRAPARQGNAGRSVNQPCSANV